MLSDLKEWEQTRPRSAPKVLVIASGTVEENRAAGLRSTVLLDQSFVTGNAFGAQGTPMAVMIDAGGRIASEVVGGAAQVFALLAGSPDAQRVASV